VEDIIVLSMGITTHGDGVGFLIGGRREGGGRRTSAMLL